jgi:arylsulfatase A
VFFTSDNGPAVTGKHPYGSAGDLRGKKGYIWDGGIRVPGILRWPRKIKAGTVSSEPVCGVDVLPTLCDLAGIEKPKDRKIDGTSIAPLFSGKKIVRETPLCWHFIRASSTVKVAMRKGDWKLVARITGDPLKPNTSITEEEIALNKEAELTGFELFNLAKESNETTVMNKKESSRFELMKSEMLSLYHEVREESPVWPVWEFPRYEGQRIEWPEYKALRKPPVYRK